MKQKDFSYLKAYVIPLLVLVTIIALIPLAIRPQVTQLKENYVNLQEKRERLDKLNEKIDTLDSIDENKENTMLIEAEKAVPSRKELAHWLNEINILADKNGLIKLGINIKPGQVATESATPETSSKQTQTSSQKTVNEEKKDETNFTVSLGGGLDAMKQFLTDLEGAKPLLSVVTLDSKLQEDGTYRFDLQMKAPFKGVKSQGDVVAAPIPSITSALEKVLATIRELVSYTAIAGPRVPTGVEDPFK